MQTFATYSQLYHAKIHATDGDIGGCKDLYFDQDTHTVRYIAADTNTWLPLSRKVVITPIAVQSVSEGIISVNKTKDAIKNSPSLDEHQPISREYESLLFQYYGYGYYWTGPGAWGEFSHPTQLVDNVIQEEIEDVEDRSNPLRSCDEVTGYSVHAQDGSFGHVSDFIINLKTWAITHVVINSSNWLPGGDKRVIGIDKIADFDWASHSISVSATIDDIKHAAEFDEDSLT